MKWSKTPKDKVELGVGQELALECDASGSPQPVIEWFKHWNEHFGGANGEYRIDGKLSALLFAILWLNHFGLPFFNSCSGSELLAKGKQLKITRAKDKDSGLYECTAKNGVDADLRKIVQVKVRGK